MHRENGKDGKKYYQIFKIIHRTSKRTGFFFNILPKIYMFILTTTYKKINV